MSWKPGLAEIFHSKLKCSFGLHSSRNYKSYNFLANICFLRFDVPLNSIVQLAIDLMSSRFRSLGLTKKYILDPTALILLINSTLALLLLLKINKIRNDPWDPQSFRWNTSNTTRCWIDRRKFGSYRRTKLIENWWLTLNKFFFSLILSAKRMWYNECAHMQTKILLEAICYHLS